MVSLNILIIVWVVASSEDDGIITGGLVTNASKVDTEDEAGSFPCFLVRVVDALFGSG